MLRFSQVLLIGLFLLVGVACQTADSSNSSHSVLTPMATQPAELALTSVQPLVTTEANATSSNTPIIINTPSPTLTPTVSMVTPTLTLTETSAPALNALTSQLQGTVDAVFIQDEYLYLNVGPYLAILKLTNPSQPEMVGSVKLPIRTVSDIDVINGYAYIAADEAGLRIVDVWNPVAPAEVGSYLPPVRNSAQKPLSRSGPEAPNYLYSGGARAVVVENASETDRPIYAYVAAQGAGLRIVDVSNPATPAEVGFYEMPGDAVGVAVADGYAYVAAFEAGLRIIDVAQPTTPVEIGSLSRDQEWFLGVAAIDHHVYIAEGFCHDLIGCRGFLKGVNASNPAAPTVTWHENIGAMMRRLVREYGV